MAASHSFRASSSSSSSAAAASSSSFSIRAYGLIIPIPLLDDVLLNYIPEEQEKEKEQREREGEGEGEETS